MGGMEKMIRRFVNIVAERRNSGTYTLHRLDVSKHLHLGYLRNGHSILVGLGNSLSCFDVLRFVSLYSDDWAPIRGRGWRWDPLPPPPFAANVRSHTVVDGGSTICVSTVPSPDGGTYCFDTVKHEWRQAGDGWVLPFDGAAEYVPDLKLWMGFCSDSLQLCAWDLSAKDKPPTLQHSWTDLKTPEEWSVSMFNLLNLGAGCFCIAKTFRVVSDGRESFEDKFAVLTGIQMVTGGGDQDDQEGLKMIRHKSIRYMFTNEMIRWVL